MLHTLYIGPFYSMSTAGIVFRRLIDTLVAEDHDHSYSATSYTDIFSSPYTPTATEELNFLEISASKQAHLALKDSQAVAIIFVNSTQDLDERLLESLFEGGIIPALVVVCGPDAPQVREQALGQNSKLRQAGVDIVYLDEAGSKDSATAFWRQKTPIAAAATNITENTDMVLYGYSLDDLIQTVKKLPKGKKLYLYDPGDTIKLNFKHPAIKQINEHLAENDSELITFSFKTVNELLALTDGKSTIIPDQKNCVFLGAALEPVATAARRSLEIANDARIIILHKFPQVPQPSIQDAVAMAMKQVPDMPAAMAAKVEANAQADKA